MKQQISKIIEEVADKSLTFGCAVNNKEFGYTRTIYKVEDESVVYMPEIPNDYLCDFKEHYDNGKFKVIGNPVMIGDVLKKIKEMMDKEEFASNEWNTLNFRMLDIIEAWGLCGFTTSLNTLFDGAEWEKVNHTEHDNCTHTLDKDNNFLVPKDKATYELFLILCNLNLIC